MGQGLAISALVHLGALACILWIQAQRTVEEVVLINRPVDLVPRIADPFVPPPIVSTGSETQADHGTIKPTHRTIPPIVLPKIDPGSGVVRPGAIPGPPREPGGRDVGESRVLVNPDPPEDAFVAYDEPPVPVFKPDPGYPEWARENGIEGRVVLHALVGVDGRVRRVTVIRNIPGLTESAQEALYRWTFKPAKAGHQPIAVWIEVPFSFRL